MKIILVDNLLLHRENDSRHFILQPHLGLISLIAVLEQAGHEASLYDPKMDIVSGKLIVDDTLYREISAEIIRRQPDAVGLTSLGCNFICTLKIARYLKQARPALPILLGGPHATVLHREIISACPEFDVIVRNEAEQKIVPVLESLFHGGLEQIEGITYRRNGVPAETEGVSIIADLDSLPVPAYHAYPIAASGLDSLRVEAGRGCPFSCTFCSTATFFGRSYRLKSAEKLCKELDFLHAQYGISDFGLTHDLFTVNKTKVAEFCHEVSKRAYTWRCSARMDCVDAGLLATMKAAGCSSIYYGIETGSQRMQKISRKKLDLDIFESTLDITLELGIAPTLSFIIGYPEENLEDANATLDMLGHCLLRESSTPLFVQLHLLTPEPGTALHEQYKHRMGFDHYISDFNFPTLEEDDAALMQQHPEIFMNHHYYETLLPREFFVITASLFECLLALGPVLSRYLLTQFDRSLPLLNAEVYAWCREKEIHSMNNDLLTAFISQRFSHHHVLTSLLRYQFETIRLQQSGIDEDEQSGKMVAGEQEQPAAEADPGFRLLRNIHDCTEIIRRLQSRKKITAKMLEQRHDYVLHLHQNRKRKKILECYRLNKTAETVFRPIEAAVTSRTDLFLQNWERNHSSSLVS